MRNTGTTAGRVIDFALYEAYGTRPYEYNPSGDPDRQKANTKEEEKDLDLLNEGMRYRDLETGTFLTRDPIGYADGPNVYCYVHCNPITKFDAFGLALKEVNEQFVIKVLPQKTVEKMYRDQGKTPPADGGGATLVVWPRYITGFKSTKHQQRYENARAGTFVFPPSDRTKEVFGEVSVDTYCISDGLQGPRIQNVSAHEKEHLDNHISKWNDLCRELNGAKQDDLSRSQQKAYTKYSKLALEHAKESADLEDKRIDHNYRVKRGDYSNKSDKFAQARKARAEGHIKREEAKLDELKNQKEEAKKEYEKSLED